MRTDLWRSHEGILLVCFLLSKLEQRSLKVAASSCGRRYFRKRSSCGRGYLFIRIKKDAFSKRFEYVWTGPQPSRDMEQILLCKFQCLYFHLVLQQVAEAQSFQKSNNPCKPCKMKRLCCKCYCTGCLKKNCSTFDKILKNKDNMNRLMER